MCRGPVDLAGAGLRHRQPGLDGLQRAERRPAAQGQADLAGQLDGAAVDRDEQRVGEQPAHGAVGVGGRHGPQRVADLAERRTGGEGLEDLAAAVVHPRQQRVQPGAVGEQLRRPGDPRPRRQVERLEQGGELAVGVARQAGGHRAPEPGGTRARDLAHRADQVQRVVAAPDQREVAQPVDARLHLGRARRPAHQRAEPRERARVLGEHEPVDERQAERVELLQGAQHRQPHAGAGREHAQVGRHGDGEVGARAQQGREALVRPRAQPVGEAARRRVHPGEASRRVRFRLVAPGQGSRMSEQGGLVPDEGVDEGSAAGAVEGLDERAGDGDVLSTGDVVGEPPRGAPEDEAQAAGPVDMESEQSRGARAEQGSGQQLQEGEG